MPWIKIPQILEEKETQLSTLLYTKKNCSLAQAQREALKNPKIKFFSYCHEKTEFENPHQQFDANDILFFSSQPCFANTRKIDTYQKTGISVVYICETENMVQDMADTSSYVTADGTPAIDIVCIFAANINKSPIGSAQRLAPAIIVQNGAVACGNPDIVKVLESGVVKNLQQAGITVLLTFLNNHDDSGWSQFGSVDDAQCFTNQLQYIVNTYGLDGIDIDDEYSAGLELTSSLAMVTTLMRQKMPNIIISKALWNDFPYFSASYNGNSLAQNLTYGWQMTYGSSPSNTLPPYLQFKMSQEQLFKGFWADSRPEDLSADIAWLKSNGYGGMMVYNFNSSDNLNLMKELVIDWYGAGSWNKKPKFPSRESFLLRVEEKEAVSSSVEKPLVELKSKKKELNAEKIIAAINSDANGTNGFNDEDLQDFIIDNYGLANKPQSLRKDILAYRLSIRKIKDVTKYATYGVSLLITALGAAGVQLSTSDTAATTPKTVLSAVSAGLGIIILLIKGICEPWAEHNDEVVKRLEAALIYAKKHQLFSDIKVSSSHPPAAALARSMAMGIISRSGVTGVGNTVTEERKFSPPTPAANADPVMERPGITA